MERDRDTEVLTSEAYALYQQDYSLVPDLCCIDQLNLEISTLAKEIDSLCVKSLDWSLGDFLCVFLTGVVGGLCDLVIGKADGFDEPKLKNSSLGGLGKKLKEYDLKSNPIDAHIPGAKLGDHRLYSYGHDLFRLIDGVRIIMNGKGKLGVAGTSGVLELSQLQEGFTPPDEIWKAVIVLLLHLFKDFWTHRSLPIPGSTIIADLNGHKMPQWLDVITNDKDVNLRTLTGQGLSYGVNEMIPWLYLNLSSSDKQLDKRLFSEKLSIMKLMGHTISMLFNVGKVIATKNPFLLNVAQMLRILSLATKVIGMSIERNHMAIIKVSNQALKNKLELLETMIITDKAVQLVIATNQAIDQEALRWYENKLDKGLKRHEALIDMSRKIEELQEINNRLGGICE
jgi:hypothetical protein